MSAERNPPIHRTSLADQVYLRLREMIAAGELEPGAELNSVSLAERLEVSRTPINEALQRLVHDELVAWPHGRKARVAAFTRDDLIAIYDLRELLTRHAIGRAAASIPAPRLTELRTSANAAVVAFGTPDWTARVLAIATAIHSAIADSAGNPRLARDLDRYRWLVAAGVHRIQNEAYVQHTLRNQLELLSALEAKAPAAAERAALSQLSYEREALLAAWEPQ